MRRFQGLMEIAENMSVIIISKVLQNTGNTMYGFREGMKVQGRNNCAFDYLQHYYTLLRISNLLFKNLCCMNALLYLVCINLSYYWLEKHFSSSSRNIWQDSNYENDLLVSPVSVCI